MKPEELVKDIQTYCEAHRNPAVVKKYSRYFKEGYDAYGLTPEELIAKRDEILSKPGLNKELIIATGFLLVSGPRYEETSFAIHLLMPFRDDPGPEVFTAVEKWFSLGIRNWAHTDITCGELISWLLMKGTVSISALAAWRSSANKFQRRAVPVALIKLLKPANDFADFFALIESLMTDKAREVQQGLGWFLREAWKLRAGETEAFLLKWKNSSPRLIFQYACEKMSPKERERFSKDR